MKRSAMERELKELRESYAAEIRDPHRPIIEMLYDFQENVIGITVAVLSESRLRPAIPRQKPHNKREKDK